MTTQPNQPEDTELDAKTPQEDYYSVALGFLVDAIDNDEIYIGNEKPSGGREKVVDNKTTHRLANLIEAEAARRERAAEERTHRIYKRELDNQKRQVETLMQAHHLRTEPTPFVMPESDAIRFAQQALLDELKKEASERYEAAGRHTTRNKFSRTTETRGEAYARTQGFKSALLVWKDCIATKRQALTEKEVK